MSLINNLDNNEKTSEEQDIINSNQSSKKIKETELFMKYKSSYKAAFIDYNINLFILFLFNYIIYCLKNSIYVYFMIPIMALLNIKTFMSLHDCTHGSYTPSSKLNYIIGTFSGIITCTSSFNWGLDHNIHHLTNGAIKQRSYRTSQNLMFLIYLN